MVIVAQNAGIARTSVSHASLLVGATPILIALMAAALGRSVAGPLSWVGFAAALGGVGIIAADGGGSATLAGDGLVCASLVFSAAFVVAQPRLLAGRDPAAVTAVQFAAAAVATLPVAAWLDGPPTIAAPDAATLVAMAALVIGGTLAPFVLFAYGQARVAPETAGAFLNLEPLVGAAAGALAFGDPVGPAQLIGGAAVLGGIALTATRLGQRQLRGAGLEVALFGDAERTACGEPVVAARSLPIAGDVEQVRADGVDPVVASERRVGLRLG
jgi:O-acetylserine/cysteine efflux transporter